MSSVGSSRRWEPGLTVAGKYRIERVIATGGQATVFEAMHLGLEQRVAIKARRLDRGEKESEAREQIRRMIREARAAFRLRGPHVAHILDVELLDGEPFIVMEYLHGKDLRRLLSRQGAVAVDHAVGLLLQACEAIAEAHDHGIVHRDLKPANLFLVDSPEWAPLLKVLDFGISRLTPAAVGGADVSALTRGSHLLGTPSYVAPEQLRDPRLADARADLWSLGTIFQELVTGMPVFHGRTPIETMTMVLELEPPALGTLRPDVPLPLQRVVQRCLQKSPDFRFADARELALALAPHAPSWAAPNLARLRARQATPVRRHVTPVENAIPWVPRRAPDLGSAVTGVTVGLGPVGQQPDHAGAFTPTPTPEGPAAPAPDARLLDEAPLPVPRGSARRALFLSAWALVGSASGAGAIGIALGGAERPGAAIKRLIARVGVPDTQRADQKPVAMRGPVVESLQQRVATPPPLPPLPRAPAPAPADAPVPLPTATTTQPVPARPRSRVVGTVRHAKRARRRAAPAPSAPAFAAPPVGAAPPVDVAIAAPARVDDPLDGRQ